MTIRASRLSLIFASPSVAVLWRLPPSKEKGRVTMPTQSMPISLMISAMTGRAPVPAPPPRPAVRNTMSVSRRASLMASLSSLAARSPSSELPPVP